MSDRSWPINTNESSIRPDGVSSINLSQSEITKVQTTEHIPANDQNLLNDKIDKELKKDFKLIIIFIFVVISFAFVLTCF